MYKIKKGVVGLFGFLLITWVFAAGSATAAPNGSLNVQSGQNTQSVQQQKAGQNKLFKYDPFFGLMHKLNMSDAQKAQVAEILKSNENRAKTVAHETANAVVQVRKDFVQGKFNAEHFDNLIKYERQGAELRAQVMASVLPKLTQEQRTNLASMQDKVGSQINSRIDSRFARLDSWIAKHEGSKSGAHKS